MDELPFIPSDVEGRARNLAGIGFSTPLEVNGGDLGLRRQLEKEKVRQVDRALDRAAENVMKDFPDAGVPHSDDCSGKALKLGRCECAHLRCMDTCCPVGWGCAHSGAPQAKCVRAP